MGRRRVIALVGIDGTGKTTQARQLARWLCGQGIPASYFENGGGRPVFDRLARVLGRRDGVALFGRRAYPMIEATLRGVGIARALVWSRLTRRTAVMDRYTYCQYAMMRYRGDRGERLVQAAYSWFPRPDLVCFLAAAPDRARDRVLARGIDTEEPDHLQARDRAYRSLPEFGGFVVVDADAELTVVAEALHRAVRQSGF
ncbi:thymidylate kinase [Micromonospora sp. CPCC 206060]|uniref:dTMP kinase n=1 Tax=Micromonospora sp. CPCC 206060 TaxID=3122406 RepID=UPI002FF10BDA